MCMPYVSTTGVSVILTLFEEAKLSIPHISASIRPAAELKGIVMCRGVTGGSRGWNHSLSSIPKVIRVLGWKVNFGIKLRIRTRVVHTYNSGQGCNEDIQISSPHLCPAEFRIFSSCSVVETVQIGRYRYRLRYLPGLSGGW